MRTSTKLAGSITAALIFASAASWGHTKLVSPAPRDVDAGNADSHKAGPCGGVVKGTKPSMKIAGNATTMNVQWLETIDHTGCFVLDVSESGNDNDFKVLKVVKDPTNAGVSRATPRSVMTNIALDGGIKCPNCTFRLRQIMGADPNTCNGSTVGTGGTYFSCADIMMGDFDAGVPLPVADAAVVPEEDSGSSTGDDSGTGSGSDGGSAGVDGGGGGGLGDEDDTLPPNTNSGCATSPMPTSGFAGLAALTAVAGLAVARAKKKQKKQKK